MQHWACMVRAQRLLDTAVTSFEGQFEPLWLWHSTNIHKHAIKWKNSPFFRVNIIHRPCCNEQFINHNKHMNAITGMAQNSIMHGNHLYKLHHLGMKGWMARMQDVACTVGPVLTDTRLAKLTSIYVRYNVTTLSNVSQSYGCLCLFEQWSHTQLPINQHVYSCSSRWHVTCLPWVTDISCFLHWVHSELLCKQFIVWKQQTTHSWLLSHKYKENHKWSINQKQLIGPITWGDMSI